MVLYRLLLTVMMPCCNRSNFVCTLFLFVSDRRMLISYELEHSIMRLLVHVVQQNDCVLWNTRARVCVPLCSNRSVFCRKHMNIDLAGSCEHTQLLNVPFRGLKWTNFQLLLALKNCCLVACSLYLRSQ